MNELEQSIHRIKGEYDQKEYEKSDCIGQHEANILNAVATGQLVPAQTCQPIKTTPKDETPLRRCISCGGMERARKRGAFSHGPDCPLAHKPAKGA